MSQVAVPELVAEAGRERWTDQELIELRLDAIKNTVIPETQKAIGLGDWQHETLQLLADNLATDQTVDLPTRSGKSYLIRQMARAATAVGIKTAIVSHRRHILAEHAEGLSRYDMTASTPIRGTKEPDIPLLSAQAVATGRVISTIQKDSIDLVLIDEAHRLLGLKTIAGMRKLFPNAVRIAFTGTPEYSEDRSVTDEYGHKLISRSVVEAISESKAAPLQAFLYKTDAEIENLDPNLADYTPRELRRLAQLVARNNAIVDIAHDLVAKGRQGLITTIPGENLLHADILFNKLRQREITTLDGRNRHIRAHVVRGSDPDLMERHQEFEDGDLDILLYAMF